MNKSIRTIVLGAIIASTALTPALSAAKPYHKSQSYTDYAKVIRVKPIVEQVEVKTPRTECYKEKVTHRSGRYESRTGTIAGAVIGGAAASAIAKDRNMKKNEHAVATIAGVLLGGAIGRDIDERKARRGHDHDYVTYEDRCETTYDVHYEEQVVGYNVKYRYHGRIYRIRTDQHPGDRIEVRVNVNPVF